MSSIKLTKEHGEFKLDRYNSINDFNTSIPYKVIHLGGYLLTYYTLNWEIHLWMVENKIEYEIDFSNRKDPNYPWTVVINDPNKAILFKLTWC
jgi:hypothetical protein